MNSIPEYCSTYHTMFDYIYNFFVFQIDLLHDHNYDLYLFDRQLSMTD